ncbi:MAG TPA: aminoglycoside phosphotransferase family protein [Acidimicrobiales bacterium]|nr:aminoglycoside phosphotransferase family protein [Acidimicrobiales bacterium]
MSRHPNLRARSSLPAELRRTTVPDQVRTWIRQVTGAAVVRVARLPGASSTAVHRIVLADGARVVLRRYVWPGFLVAEPDAPAREADALRFASAHGLPVPSLVASDPTGADVGDGIPVLLMSLLGGRAVAVPDLSRLAEVAASIHAVNADDLGHEYYCWYEQEMTTPPPLATQPRLWEKAIELWRTAMPAYRPTLIHRDFHPGNVLWSRGRATGVVDWPNACRGPIGCDLAHCRNNLRTLANPDVADEFVATYTALTGEPLDPYWIMAGHLEHDHRWWTPERLALDEPDVAAAVAALTR